MSELVIHNDNFTDDNGDLHYLNTGRDNISGLNFPNYYVKNDDNYYFTRVLNIKFSRDTSLVYPIHECFLLTTMETNSSNITTNIITVDGIVKNGTITSNNIKISCAPLNEYTETSSYSIKAATKSELDNGNTVMCLGIWLYSKDIIDILIKRLSSLSCNDIPNNISNQFLECNYEVSYLNNEDKVYDVNMFNFEESIGNKVVTSTNINKELIDKINQLNNIEIVQPANYKFLSVIYDDLYSITEINVDEIITPRSFQYAQIDNSFAKIRNNYVQVDEEGNYLIALKINMDVQNATKMTMSLFLNNDRLSETTSSLNCNPDIKIYPLGYLSGQVQLHLKPSDKLYLKARWSNIVDIENHCMMQITKLS